MHFCLIYPVIKYLAARVLLYFRFRMFLLFVHTTDVLMEKAYYAPSRMSFVSPRILLKRTPRIRVEERCQMIFSLVSVHFKADWFTFTCIYLFSSEDIPRKLKRTRRDILWHSQLVYIHYIFISQHHLYHCYNTVYYILDDNFMQKIISQLRCVINFLRVEYLKKSGYYGSRPLKKFHSPT